MAFNLIKFIESGFSPNLVPKTRAGIEEAANAILAGQDLYNNSAPLNWANEVLTILRNNPNADFNTVIDERGGAKVTLGEVATEWISGEAQRNAKKRALAGYKELKQEVQAKLSNFATNIANVTDFSNPNLTEAEKEAGRKRAEEIKASASELQALADRLGINVPEPVRTASGFQPASELKTNANPNARKLQYGRLGEPVVVIDRGNGNFEVVGTVTGTVHQTVQGTVADANREATRLQSGFAEQPSATSPSTSISEADSSTFNEVVDGIEEGVQTKEDAFTASNPDQVVTPEMRAEWLAEAWDEVNANTFYKEKIANFSSDTLTSFERLIEDTRVSQTALAKEYRDGLKNLQEDLRDRGFLYGGIRDTQEKEFAQAANTAAEAQTRQFTRAAEDTSKVAERTLGTEAATTLGNQVGTAIPGQTFTPGVATPTNQAPVRVFTTEGNKFGDMPRELEGEALTRAQELETAFRDKFSNIV